jgi:tRNA G37 N-methylase Trm5
LNSKNVLINHFAFAKRNAKANQFDEEYLFVVGDENSFLAFGEIQMMNMDENK